MPAKVKKIASKPEKKLLVEVEEKIREDSLLLEKLPGYFLVACLLIAFYYLLVVLSPFLTVLFSAAVLAIAFNPVYSWLLKYVKYSGLASLFSCLIVILLIVVPLVIFVFLLAGEAVGAYEAVRTRLDSGVFDSYFGFLQWRDGGFLYDLKQNLAPFVDVDSLNLKENIIAVAQSLSTYLVSQTANLVKGISVVLLNFVVMMFALFYFFKDGSKIVDKAGYISPLPSYYENELFHKLRSMVKAIVLGVFLTAMAQGLVGGIGFALVGIASPVFWGAAMAFFSLLPMVGTVVVWGPAVIILLILGKFAAALFLFFWGLLVIGMVDNVLRPYLIGGRAHTYPLLTFFVILGGIWVMGFKGIIVGPLILMILMSLLHIYEVEYSRVLKK